MLALRNKQLLTIVLLALLTLVVVAVVMFSITHFAMLGSLVKPSVAYPYN